MTSMYSDAREWTIEPLASLDDIDRVIDVERASFTKPWTRDMYVAELENRGLIARRPSDSDRRVHVVALTPAGMKLTVKLLEMHRRLEENLARELGLRERDQLLQLLKRFRKLATEPEIDDGKD